MADVDAKEVCLFVNGVAFVKDGDHSWIAIDKDGKDLKVEDLNGRRLDIYNIRVRPLRDMFTSEK